MSIEKRLDLTMNTQEGKKDILTHYKQTVKHVRVLRFSCSLLFMSWKYLFLRFVQYKRAPLRIPSKISLTKEN